MKGIIILAHGSRKKATEETLEKIVDMMKNIVTDYEVTYGFMEFSDKTIEAGLDILVGQGIHEIVAVPYFLFDGIHIHEDIPELLEKYQKGHPEVSIKLGETLGADERLAQILADRVRAAL